MLLTLGTDSFLIGPIGCNLIILYSSSSNLIPYIHNPGSLPVCSRKYDFRKVTVSIIPMKVIVLY